MNESKKINLDKNNVLIDLNKNLVNFDIDFQVISDSSEPFQMAVVNQTELDNNVYKFNDIVGAIEGNININKNEFQNQYILLRSEKPQQVTVNISRKELNRPLPPQPQQSMTITPEQPSKIPWFKIILIVAIILVGGYFLMKKPKSVEMEESSSMVSIRSPSPTTKLVNRLNKIEIE